jgi:hypothetical protein
MRVGLLTKQRLVQVRKLYFDRAIRLLQRDPGQECKRRLASKVHLQWWGEFQYQQYSEPILYPCFSHRKSSCNYRSGKRFTKRECVFAISKVTIYGPCSFLGGGTFTCNSCPNMLILWLLPHLEVDSSDLTLEQDGAPIHLYRAVGKNLNGHLPQIWID